MRVGVVEPETTRELRRTVLRPNLPPGAPLPGDDLSAAAHIGAVDEDDTVLGTCIVFLDPCPWRPDAGGTAWHLRQMATLPNRRGEGIGAAVLEGAVDHVRAHGASLLWCHARESAAGFYARHGFQRHGATFIDPEHPIPHIRMFRELSQGPTSSG